MYYSYLCEPLCVRAVVAMRKKENVLYRIKRKTLKGKGGKEGGEEEATHWRGGERRKKLKEK